MMAIAAQTTLLRASLCFNKFLAKVELLAFEMTVYRGSTRLNDMFVLDVDHHLGQNRSTNDLPGIWFDCAAISNTYAAGVTQHFIV